VISSSSSSSIFNFNKKEEAAETGDNKDTKPVEAEVKETPAPAAKKETSSSIFNTVSPREKQSNTPSRPNTNPTPTSNNATNNKNDDDDWSSVPAFLRRNRKK